MAVGTLPEPPQARQVVDASGLQVLPGMVDPHVHIHWPFLAATSRDNFYTGTRAAALGGTTTIIDYAIQRECHPQEAFEQRRKEVEGQAAVDYALTQVLAEHSDRTLDAIPQLMAQGVTAFKCYLIYRKRGIMVDDAMLLEVLRRLREHGGLLTVHAENAAIAEYWEARYVREGKKDARYFVQAKGNVVEAECINRAVYLACFVGANLYIRHISTREGTEVVGRARQAGHRIYGETCSHYLALTDEVYGRTDGFKFICSPPIKSAADREALWAGLRSGELSAIGADHVAFDLAQKLEGKEAFDQVPNGLPGIETRFPVAYTEGVARGRLSLNRLVEVMSTNPAKLFGLYPRKGALLPGSDADVVLVDPSAERVLTATDLHMDVDWTPYEGMRVRGFPKVVIARGEVVVQDGIFLGRPGRGEFLKAGLPVHC
ncbi:MAG: dihydropyrimidinase [Deltaproteobacteria bacterium]|nr:dihydropyrimidinase [Deltaproteobacteria bacterium]